jgi:hypothetical protein
VRAVTFESIDEPQSLLTIGERQPVVISFDWFDGRKNDRLLDCYLLQPGEILDDRGFVVLDPLPVRFADRAFPGAVSQLRAVHVEMDIRGD